jgi:type I restriction enzyme S subunit
MIADLKPYPDYKQSGLPWAERVPSHWHFRRTKVLFGERVQKGFPNEPLLAATQSKGVVKKTDYGERTVTASKDFHLLKLVEPGDFVISLRSFQGGLEIAHCRGIISPAYTILKPRHEARREYFKQFFKSPGFIDSLTLFVTGIREGQNIDYERLSRAYLPVPPADEQEAIGRFLNHWNGRLEKAIRAKRRVIALLQEQKQAIIHRAVTRGLDPNAKLKDSGIPWLGQTPEHWEPMPNRANLKIRKKLVGERSSEYTLLSLTMRGVIARDMDNPTGKFPAEFNTYQEVRPGDLIFCLFDIDETPRGVGISRLNGMITGAYTVFEPRNPEITEFLYLHYLAMDEEKCLKPLYTGLRKTIPKPRFLGIKTPIPPPDERIAIVNHIKEETCRIETIIARYEREIALLREYRTRLTAEVVTGKLDVRAAAAQLPEEAAEESLPDPELPEEEPELEEVEG